MACEFTMTHRVEFADTDLAGIMHFANFFRYMEVTEHAFLRSLGFSVHMEMEGRRIGWPRVRAVCDYKNPLRFEDEVEVHLIVREKRSKSLTYDFHFRKKEGEFSTEVARGSLIVVCVTMDGQTGKMKAAAIPEALASRIEAAPSVSSGAHRRLYEPGLPRDVPSGPTEVDKEREARLPERGRSVAPPQHREEG